MLLPDPRVRMLVPIPPVQPLARHHTPLPTSLTLRHAFTGLYSATHAPVAPRNSQEWAHSTTPLSPSPLQSIHHYIHDIQHPNATPATPDPQPRQHTKVLRQVCGLPRAPRRAPTRRNDRSPRTRTTATSGRTTLGRSVWQPAADRARRI